MNSGDPFDIDPDDSVKLRIKNEEWDARKANAQANDLAEMLVQIGEADELSAETLDAEPLAQFVHENDLPAELLDDDLADEVVEMRLTTALRQAETRSSIAHKRLEEMRSRVELRQTILENERKAEIDQLTHELEVANAVKRARLEGIELDRREAEAKWKAENPHVVATSSYGRSSTAPYALRLPDFYVPVFELHESRADLVREFPHAESVIDSLLRPLAGRATVWIRPTLFVGSPGSGKSRFARRVAEVLGIDLWRVDAGREDSNSFAGTEKRWSTAEPCHPLAAILRAKHMNPALLLDELEKAGTGTRNGRLWDCLLGFLEPENAARYPDPYYQRPVDLCGISYLATANSLTGLPAALLDRFRVIPFPEPDIEHLPALLPQIIAEIAAEADLPVDWYPALAGDELEAIRGVWSDRSIRSLRRIVEAVLTARELAAQRH